MTTEVIIRANHGWPVRVLPLVANGSKTFVTEVLVPAGQEYRTSVHSSQDLLIHEVQPDEDVAKPLDVRDPMLKYFAWEHLPPALQPVSMNFFSLARRLVEVLPGCPERTVALRKLLEAKDCAVRAALER